MCKREIEKFDVDSIHKRYGEPYFEPNRQLCIHHYEMFCHYHKMHRNREERHQWLVDIIRDEKVESVGELGCGIGMWQALVGKQLHIKYVGYDTRKNVLRMARVVVPKTKFLKLDIYNEKPEQHFDLFFSRHVMNHQENPKVFLERTLGCGSTIVHILNQSFPSETKLINNTVDHTFHGDPVEHHWDTLFSGEQIAELADDFTSWDFEHKDNHLIFRKKQI